MIYRSKHTNNIIDFNRILLGVSTIMFFITLGFRINTAGKLAVKNEELKVLDEKKGQLEKDVALLEYEDSKYSSLKNVELAAQSLGFIKSTGTMISIDLTSGSPLATAR
jgi:hypothetical protein